MSTTSKISYPWQAAFVAYCNGSPIDEIAQVFDIPLDKVHRHMAAEGWAGLRARLPLVTLQQTTTDGQMVKEGEGTECMGRRGTPQALVPAVAAKLELIQQNRDANLAVFVQLREHLVENVRGLRDGTLKIERLFHFKGSVVEHASTPGPGDWVNIAAYARTIAEGTYRALGDFQSQEKAGQDAAAGASAPSGPAITIILPNVIASPREERVLQSEVIDCQATTVTEPAN